jgi:hypothetical protein
MEAPEDLMEVLFLVHTGPLHSHVARNREKGSKLPLPSTVPTTLEKDRHRDRDLL